MTDMYSLSTDEENYNGQYDSIEEAVAEAVQMYGDGTFWVGRCVEPTDPAQYFDAESYFEHVSEQEEYCHEWGEDWMTANREQYRELESEVQSVIRNWLDRHDLRPKFWNIGDTFKYIVKDGVASRPPV